MNLIQFHTFYPELAERETRTLTTFGQDGLSADTYGLGSPTATTRTATVGE